jgi:hypothetical protein
MSLVASLIAFGKLQVNVRLCQWGVEHLLACKGKLMSSISWI